MGVISFNVISVRGWIYNIIKVFLHGPQSKYIRFVLVPQFAYSKRLHTPYSYDKVIMINTLAASERMRKYASRIRSSKVINLSDLLAFTARNHPEKTAVIDPEASLTYGELERWARRIASGLSKHGLGKGNRIGLVCPTNRFFIPCYFGVLKTGATVVPLNILLKSEQFRDQLGFAEVDACICLETAVGISLAEEVVEAVEQVPSCKKLWIIPTEGRLFSGEKAHPFADIEGEGNESFETVYCQPGDTAIINFTSGTTGLPKGAELDHASDLIIPQAYAMAMGIRHDDVIVGSAGLFMGFGRSVLMNPAIFMGATLVLLPKFEPQTTLAAMTQHSASIFVGAPATFHTLWRLAEAGSWDYRSMADHWRLGIYGGAPMSAWLRQALTHNLGMQLFQAYGSTEAGPIAHTPADGSVGEPEDIVAPQWGNELRVVDEMMNPVHPGELGEVVARGAGVMKGYYNNPRENEEVFRGGWLHTGDMARVRENGAFTLVGRRVETINRGGYKVYPAELERILMEHPEVDRAAIKGIPHDRLGQEIAAFILLKQGSLETNDSLFAWARDKMPRYAYPRILVIMDQMPIGPTGKVIKGQLPVPEIVED